MHPNSAARTPLGPPGLQHRWSPLVPESKAVLRPKQFPLPPSASFHRKIDRFISHCGLPLPQSLPHFQSEANRKLSHPTCGQHRASGETPQGTSFITTEEDVLGSWTPTSGAAEARAAVAAATVFRPLFKSEQKTRSTPHGWEVPRLSLPSCPSGG